MFACSAVGLKRDGLGKEVPDLTKPPRGLIEPLEYCLEALHRNRALLEETRSREALAVEAEAAARRVADEERRAASMSNAVLFGSLALAGLVIAVLVYVVVVRR